MRYIEKSSYYVKDTLFWTNMAQNRICLINLSESLLRRISQISVKRFVGHVENLIYYVMKPGFIMDQYDWKSELLDIF
jgi:hypothetical protein